MKILLFGKNGQVGTALQRSLADAGDVIALTRGDTALCGNLADLSGIAETVRQVRPDVIVNAAAYTAVEKAESEPDLAMLINAKAPAVLAQQAGALGAWLVHYSTDYVFNGEGSQFWTETDPTGPLNVYGKSKLAGEQAIVKSGCKHLIFRTSWVHDPHGSNFIKTILRLAQDKDELAMVADQIGAPTAARLIADVTALALQQIKTAPSKAGLYHLAAAGEVSWFEYAKFIVRHAREGGMPLRLHEDAISPVPTSERKGPARRPANSRLGTQKLRAMFGAALPDWQTDAAKTIEAFRKTLA